MSNSEEQASWNRPPGVPKRLLDRVEKAYEQTLTAIWVGNGAAAIATIQFIDKAGGWLTLAALCSFLLGLIALGGGSIWYLAKERERLERFELLQSPTDTNFSDVQSQAAEIGLALRGRTIGGLIAAVSFVLGCVFGIVELLNLV